MEKKSNEIRLIDRLRNGETITCLECSKGTYVTSAKDIKISHCFVCDNCGSMVEVLPAAPIVE